MKKPNFMKGLAVCVLTSAMVVTSCFPALAASTSNEVSERETRNAALSMDAATEGMVLLENKNNVLPIATSGNIALFGGGAYNTIKGGTGSGAVNQRNTVSVWQGFQNAQYNITSSAWLEGYKAQFDAGNTGNPGGGFGSSYSLADYALTDADISAASGTAIYVVSRNSGEGRDRTATSGDYYLTDIEYANIQKVADSYENSVVILNVGGIVDTKFAKEISNLDSVLLMSQAGMRGGDAVVKVLNGTVTPSGKLSDTWAVNYSDYPSSASFSSNDANTTYEDYTDDIYVGYRYFDTFNVTPAYEFGYGLSYTTFEQNIISVKADEKQVTVKVKVTNTGDTYSGKEVVQVYFSAPAGTLEKPYQELAAFAKTDVLEPKKSQTLTISFNTTEMSSYSEAKAAYIMEEGNYVIRVGNSSRNTHVGAVLTLDQTVSTEQLSNEMVIDNAIATLSQSGVTPYTYDQEAKELSSARTIKLSPDKLNLIDGNNASEYENEVVTTYVTEETKDDLVDVTSPYDQIIKTVDVKDDATLFDVYNGTISMEQFIAGLTVPQLANIVEGISGNPVTVPLAQDNSVRGTAGETTGHYIVTDGIPNITLADGPAGVRITQSYNKGTDGVFYTYIDSSGRPYNIQGGTTYYAPEGVTATTYYQFCTAWPIGTLLAQTWDMELTKKVYTAVGEEMLEYGVTLWLAPGLNIHRNPLCGRNFEYYTEDPFLNGSVAMAATLGVQSHPGIGVTLKHYAGNQQENNRNAVMNHISERAMREIYLKGFEIAVKGAQPMAIMTAYNQNNGDPAADDYDLCTDIPRGEWGFEGLIMTDWGGGQSKPPVSMHAGNDLIMPGNSQMAIIAAATDNNYPTFGTDGYAVVRNNIEYWHDFALSASGTETLSTTVAAGRNLNSRVAQKVTDGIATVTVNSDNTRTVTYKGNIIINNTLYLGDLQKSAMNVLNIVMQSTQFAKLNTEKGVTAVSYRNQFNDLKSYLIVDKLGN